MLSRLELKCIWSHSQHLDFTTVRNENVFIAIDACKKLRWEPTTREQERKIKWNNKERRKKIERETLRNCWNYVSEWETKGEIIMKWRRRKPVLFHINEEHRRLNERYTKYLPDFQIIESFVVRANEWWDR